MGFNLRRVTREIAAQPFFFHAREISFFYPPLRFCGRLRAALTQTLAHSSALTSRSARLGRHFAARHVLRVPPYPSVSANSMQVSVGSYLIDIPDVAVGAIGAAITGLIGAFVALVSVGITNWNSHRQQVAKLDHDKRQQAEKLKNDAIQADRARQMQIRRDVYLQASADIAAFIGTLGRYTSLDFPEEKLFEYLERFSQAIARIQLVADKASLETCGNLQRALAVSTFEIQRKRLSLQIRHGEIAFRERDKQDLIRDNNQIVELSKQYEPGKEQAAKLLKLFEAAQTRLQLATSALNSLHEAQLQEQLQLVRDLSAILKNLAPQVPELTSAVRAELEFPDVGGVLQYQQELTLKVTLEEMNKSLAHLQ
jgi:hypothetical protein